MQDAFTGKLTRIYGHILPDAVSRAAIQHDHERRLEALARLGQAAIQCGLRADSDLDLVLLAEDEVSLLKGAGPEWATLNETIQAWRSLLPLRTLGDFGFPVEAENPLEEPNEKMRWIGTGVEAWAFTAKADGSVYKFYLPREEKQIGSVFGFKVGEETSLIAEARLGDYRGLLEKLYLIHILSGMATEVVAVTPEGIVVAKQSLGEPLPQGDDMSRRLPAGLIEIPSRFLRSNRDHPRLLFSSECAWLVADLHARNFVRSTDGGLHVIDLVAAPWPMAETAQSPLIRNWLTEVRKNPSAPLLGTSSDDEL